MTFVTSIRSFLTNRGSSNDSSVKWSKGAEMKHLSAETIRLLSSSQVITSVANVVKELVENSLDAGASSVDVKLENYGLDRIEVRDNGSGISAADTPVMAVKHYTSKISSPQDLEHLETYGFRGEALGSICAVSEVVLTTKTADDDVSTQYTLDLTGKVIGRRPSHLGQGTTVCVLKLFKNLPVRRQFYANVKKCKEELKKVQDLLMAYAIIKPELRVTYTHNKAVVWQKPKVSDRRTALLAVLGTASIANLLPLQHRQEQPKVTIEGYFPKPGSDCAITSSCNPDKTFIFINDRPVHHKDILKVVRQQYNSQYREDSAHNRYPMLAMSISVPASSIDVNLTPDKTQVMLHNKDAVLSAVEAMLMSLYGPQTSCGSTTESDDVPAECTGLSPHTSVPNDTLTDPGPEGLITQCETSLREVPLHCSEVPQPTTPEPHPLPTAHNESGSESSLNQTANISSSSSSEDWVINKYSCEFNLESSPVNEGVQSNCVGLNNCPSPSGLERLDIPDQAQDNDIAEISVDSWSRGWACKNSDTGEYLVPVKTHRPAEPQEEMEVDPMKDPCKKKASNAVNEKMIKLSMYDLISSHTVRQPMSANAIFQQEVRPLILQENPKASQQEVAITVKEKWKNLKEEDKQKYEEKAEKDMHRYKLQSKQASERGAMASDPERRSLALKRKAPLSNQTEALLFKQLLEDKALPVVCLENPIELTESVLGGAESRLLSNGFQIRLIPGSPSIKDRLEVVGIAGCVPFLGVADLKEILTAVVKRKATSVRESRPLKVISYLEGEAVRLARQLPPRISKDQAIGGGPGSRCWLLPSSDSRLRWAEALAVGDPLADGVRCGLLDSAPVVATLAFEQQLRMCLRAPLFWHRGQAGDSAFPQQNKLDRLGRTSLTARIKNLSRLGSAFYRSAPETLLSAACSHLVRAPRCRIPTILLARSSSADERTSSWIGALLSFPCALN
ncbi:hypothetical protein AGOR_G00214340 [Albula goreensis]|uniref:HMG box domain-containing protein n=1 Tax=Albula goreensis TaxID=1534307 RepID=A0A8T3CMV7_9TELE|nr:hypothetical protein AGOR_G00214340 [Albula goreensis]